MSLKASNKIKYFTFIFTLLIVVYHARGEFRSAYASIALFQDYLVELYSLFGHFAMAFFFMTTGYLLYNNLTKDNACEKIKRRVKSLLIPFIIWNVIFMIAEIVILHRPINGIYDLLIGFSFFPYDGPLWYVFAIFVLSLLATLIIRITDKRIHKAIVIIISLVSLFIYFYFYTTISVSESKEFITWIVRFCGYFPCYLVGSYIGLFHKESIEKTICNKYKTIIKVLLIVCTIIWVIIIDSLYFKEILTIASPILLWLIFDGEFFEKPLSEYVKNSFIIYASHGIVVSFVTKFIEPKLISTSNLSLAFVLLQPYLCAFVVYILCYIGVLLLSKFGLSKVVNIISGNRK